MVDMACSWINNTRAGRNPASSDIAGRADATGGKNSGKTITGAGAQSEMQLGVSGEQGKGTWLTLEARPSAVTSSKEVMFLRSRSSS